MLNYNPIEEKPRERDAMFDDAVKLIQESGVAAASLIQRRLKLGYARSARLLDELEEVGIIGPANGAKPREILIPHNSRNGEFVTPQPKPEPVKFVEAPIKWNRTKYADNTPVEFEVDIGFDEEKKPVRLNLERYGNLLVIGSQFTNSIDLLNNILTISMARYSPEELRLIVVDGVRGDLIVPIQASHLLTPLIVEPDKTISAMKWCVGEIERRMKLEDQSDNPKVILLISSLGQIMCFSPAETEDNLYRIITTGRKYGVYVILGTDYPNPKMVKSIVANSPAKLVFKPTDKKIARETGILESVELTSPDEAILETMYEGRKKITIEKLDPKKIYEEVFG